MNRLIAVALLCALPILGSSGAPAAGGIDRRALVSRHDPVLRQLDPESPLSVGNGEFAFTADVTGLQTFPAVFEKTIPLGTLSQWGWHTAPNPLGWTMDRFPYAPYESHGRSVGYADIPSDKRTAEIEWLRANPHRLHLGQLGFRLVSKDGTPAAPSHLARIEQRLDLWNGLLLSRFEFDGETVQVTTLCHPARDGVAVRVSSPLLADGRLTVELRFPYGTGSATAADWTRPEAHETSLRSRGSAGARILRTLDRDSYVADARWKPAARLVAPAKHTLRLVPERAVRELEFTVEFSRSGTDAPASFDEAHRAATRHWNRFWGSGGAIDLSGSADPRWKELERRIVLSQYLTAIQCSGTLPPQETGLTFNSWEGKFHLEMHWWHAVHFALWNRVGMLERSLGYYRDILPVARGTAVRQGYRGARWPKMTGPTGVESPSSVGPFLIWQQPHPIYYAELCYRAHPDAATLATYREVVLETAEFMASFAAWDPAAGRYTLGPPLQGAQEVFPKGTTRDATFEIAYWAWGLEAAQQWRMRLGMNRDAGWDRVLQHLPPLPLADGRYLFTATTPDSYSDPRWRRDHPAVTAVLGMLPGRGADVEAMRRTFNWIWSNWNWADTWGWDYPMLAMCAARIGENGRTVDALLLDTPKNRYRINGHNHQRPGLTIYLPGNGGLLAAVAMMAAGWDGAPSGNAPGFPTDGRWTVKWEGLSRMP